MLLMLEGCAVMDLLDRVLTGGELLSPLLAKGRHDRLAGPAGDCRSPSGRPWTCRVVAPLLLRAYVEARCRVGPTMSMYAGCQP